MSLPVATTGVVSVSVVICAYDDRRWRDLRRAVDSVLSQDPRPEVVVVIDHNRDLLALARRQWDEAETGVRVVANENGQGLSGARNSGVDAARGAIVAFLDDDAAAGPGWLSALLSGFRDADVVAVGGAVRPAVDGTVPRWWADEFNWVVGCSWTGLPRETATVRNVIGCNMAFRRDAVVAAGGFVEGIGRVGTRPTGCEETDLCIRVADRAPGARVLYLPDAHADHRVPAERLRWSYFRRRCFAEGISKAAVARRNGSRRGLESEREYVRRVLPRAVLRAVLHGEPARAAAIVAGLFLTAAGYAWGRVRP